MTADNHIAELVRRLKAGEQLTDAERTKLEVYRQTKTTTTEQTLLLDVFTRTFALWLPTRTHTGPSPAAIFERQQRYQRHGIRFEVSGDAATRQIGWRTLRRLAAVGLLTISSYPGGGRGVRLTLAGWANATEVAAMPTLDETLPLLAKLAKFEARSTIAPWIAEVDLRPGMTDWGAGAGWHDPAQSVEDRLLLALAEGWVGSLADAVGRVVYRLTDEGRAILKNPPPLPDRELPEATEQSVDTFCDLFLTARNELADAKPTRPGQLPPCPLPASFIPPRAKRFTTISADDRQKNQTPAATAAQTAGHPGKGTK